MAMKLFRKIRRKKNILKVYAPYRMKGYSPYISKKWGRRVHLDLISNNGRTRQQKKWAHERGFVSRSIERYGLNDDNWKDYVSDFEYMFISPINNAYEKWVTDRLTPHYILQPYKEMLPEMYYNIIRRDGELKIIDLNDSTVISTEDFLEALKNKKRFQMIPSEVSKRYRTYLLEYRDGDFIVNNEVIEYERLEALVNRVGRYYVVREYSETRNDIKEMFNGHEPIFKFIIRNDENNEAEILSAAVQTEHPYEFGVYVGRRFSEFESHEIKIEINSGEFFNGEYEEVYLGTVPEWNSICEQVKKAAAFMSEIEYMGLFIKITDNGLKIVDYGRKPDRPVKMEVDSPLNLYLKKKAAEKTARLENHQLDTKTPFKWKVLRFFKKHYFRKGFREYMLAVWLNTVKDDFKNTKAPLSKKIWAWRRGFPSYRIEQYGLTNQNWKNILSDYDYAWLNRINNGYQKWINDKLTMRYVFEPLKQYLPEYYYFIGKRNNNGYIKKLQDTPAGYSNTVSDIISLLIEKEKLVFKPNAGTHGDGFYKLEYCDGTIFANGEAIDEAGLEKLLMSQRSTYVVTEYIDMHPELKKIYPKTVNTIRIMVLNENCDDPKIGHVYMRIGSSKTGYTDNVGYGGICCYADRETGRYYDGETIVDHKFYPCEAHPDTGVPIEGYFPNWDKVVEGLKEISLQMPQLEYLGYDIAITEEGFKIIEINIHQDLHKYVKYPEEVKEYFLRKRDLKKKQYKL